jgi:hypothetical protein
MMFHIQYIWQFGSEYSAAIGLRFELVQASPRAAQGYASFETQNGNLGDLLTPPATMLDLEGLYAPLKK